MPRQRIRANNLSDIFMSAQWRKICYNGESEDHENLPKTYENFSPDIRVILI